MEFVQGLWSILQPVQGALASLAVTLLASLILYLLRPQVKLIYGRANNSLDVVSVPSSDDGGEGQQAEIYIEKFFLQNTGRKVANNVEFVLSSFPSDISVYQPRDVQYKRVEKGHCLVQIPQIAPWELVIIDCAYINQRAAWVSSVKCAESLGREVRFWTVRQFPKWFNVSVVILCLLGIAMILQSLVALLS
ncbi:MAG: hypothetical protein ACOCYW_05780 [Roseicyclus sp.]